MNKSSALYFGKRKPKEQRDSFPLPTDEQVARLATIIEKKVRDEEVREKYAPIKHVLAMLGAGAVLGLMFISPTAAVFAKPFLDEKKQRDQNTWKRYNSYYLKRTIRRLREQKLVTLEERDGEDIVILTKSGKRRILRYSLENLAIEKTRLWDGYWRLVLYDVDSRRKALRDVFRQTIRDLGFYQLQKSVWIYPYPCEEQITFLREFYGVGNEVIYVVANKLEDDQPYRTYFNLD